MKTKTLFFIKKTAFFLLFLVVCFKVESQEVNLVPKEVYVGDEAEIRFAFDWDGTLFEDNASSIATIVTSSTIDESLDADYTIKTMQLFPSQTGYVLSVLFIPWKTGNLDLEPFDLATVFDIKPPSLFIDIPEVHIKSMLSEANEKELRPSIAPVIIPGTTYVLIALVVIVLLVCVGIIIVIVRIQSIRSWVISFMGKIWASSNFKKASRDMIILSKMALTMESKEFAAKLSLIIRTYLEGRFSHPFTAETTSSFFIIFNDLFAGTASTKANDFLQDLYEICVRCDFLHYAGSETEKAPLTKPEIDSLLERTKNAFIFFEKDGDDEGDN